MLLSSSIAYLTVSTYVLAYLLLFIFKLQSFVRGLATPTFGVLCHGAATKYHFVAAILLSWTTTMVHSRDVEDCGGTTWRKSTLKPAEIPYITMWQYWLGHTKPKKAFRLILNAFKKLLQNFKRNLSNRIFYWLTNCLPTCQPAAFRLV